VVKRQISDRELLAIRVGVGVIVTVLIYVLSVAWTCGFSQVFSVILSQLQKDFLAYGLFLYFGLGYFNFWLFYNLIEFLSGLLLQKSNGMRRWRRGFSFGCRFGSSSSGGYFPIMPNVSAQCPENTEENGWSMNYNARFI
jgi:hypothetical protein